LIFPIFEISKETFICFHMKDLPCISCN